MTGTPGEEKAAKKPKSLMVKFHPFKKIVREGTFLIPPYLKGYNGLPPVEAIACGVPVIVPRTSSMPEICGDAAYYIDPLDIRDIEEAIYVVSTDEVFRQNLAQEGLQQAKSYDWERSAKEHLAVFNGVMGP